MDWKTLGMEALQEVKEGLKEVWDKLSEADRQLAKDVAEEMAKAAGWHLMEASDVTAARLGRARASARALAFGGALIARGVFAEKLEAALIRGVKTLLVLALSKV